MDNAKFLNLKGTVSLDEESIKELKEALRKDMLDEMDNDSLSQEEASCVTEEIRCFAENLPYGVYFRFIKSTIEQVLKNTNEEKDVIYRSDKQIYDALQCINTIIKIVN